MVDNPPNSGRKIEWTGERCVPWVDDAQVLYEHLHRYSFAREFVAGKRVLDLACGEGYGADLLAEVAAVVVGVDVDARAIDHARSAYGAPNLSFVVGSMTDSEVLADAEPFDVVVCFEAIEHVQDHEAVLRLIKARLAPDGLLIMSTPDTDVYQHEHQRNNPFHVHELSSREFSALLESHFTAVSVFGQDTAVGSLIGGRGGAGSQLLTLAGDGDAWQVRDGAPHTYLIGVATDGNPPTMPSSSVMVDPARMLVTATAENALRSADDVRRELAEARRDFAEARAELDAKLADVEVLNRLYADSRAEVEELKRTIDAVDTLRKDAAARVADAEAAAARAGSDRERADAAEVSLRAAISSVRTLQRQLSEAQRAKAVAEAELESMVSSRAMRLVSGYRARIEQAFPEGSARRRVYRRALRSPEPPPVALDGRPLALPTAEKPVVSVLIAVHGKWEYTIRCLRSIEQHAPAVPFEVVVVDDASPDETADRLRGVRGIKIVSLSENVGFLRACNAGLARCSGQYVHLLNNDTEVTPGWLDTLLEVIADDPSVGAVGSRLVYPDGRLQEAGGFIFRDASACNVGKFKHPTESAFSFRRDVHYCSGASLLVRRDLFDELHGFDEQFAPAYYEDTDLCFRIRSLGLRVVYEPRSTIVHHEGISHGTDVGSGIKSFQEINRIKFATKWRDVLSRMPVNAEQPHELLVLDNPRGTVLVVDHYIPRPDEDAGSKRMYALIKAMRAMGWGVVFLPDDRNRTPRYADALEDLGVQVLHGHFDLHHQLRMMAPVISMVILSRPHVAVRYLLDVREFMPGVPIAFDTVDLHFVREQRRAELEESTALMHRAEAMRAFELSLVRTTDMTLVVSPTERELLMTEVPGARVEVLPIVHEAEVQSTDVLGRRGLVFVCSFAHPPNIDGLRWFLREVWPLVREAVPDAELDVAGREPTAAVVADVDNVDGVRLLGWVPDLTPLYARARVAIAPIRYGAGIKGKVGEAMSFGVPTVVTTMAAEGMSLIDRATALVADDPGDFAKAIVELMADDGLWRYISAEGLAHISRLYGYDATAAALGRVLALADGGPDAGS